jgi:hypothetical protein
LRTELVRILGCNVLRCQFISLILPLTLPFCSHFALFLCWLLLSVFTYKEKETKKIEEEKTPDHFIGYAIFLVIHLSFLPVFICILTFTNYF